MKAITQINGSNPSKNAQATRNLEQHQVIVTHRHLEEFMITPLQDVWERHEMMVDLLQSVAHSSFHTVVNSQGIVTQEMAIQILEALLHNRPIIFCELPDFNDEVDTYIQRLISSQLHNFVVADLTKLDDNHVRNILRHIKNTSLSYVLTSRDNILIRAKIRAFLRGLLVPPQKSLLAEIL